jgi:hypothetical protein
MTAEHNPSLLGPGDQDEISELRETTRQLSQAAYVLAQATLTGTGDLVASREQARELRVRLRELLPRLQEAPEADRPFLMKLHSDAMLDLLYVFSDGRAPRSLRIEHYARSLTHPPG